MTELAQLEASDLFPDMTGEQPDDRPLRCPPHEHAEATAMKKSSDCAGNLALLDSAFAL